MYLLIFRCIFKYLLHEPINLKKKNDSKISKQILFIFRKLNLLKNIFAHFFVYTCIKRTLIILGYQVSISVLDVLQRSLPCVLLAFCTSYCGIIFTLIFGKNFCFLLVYQMMNCKLLIVTFCITFLT